MKREVPWPVPRSLESERKEPVMNQFQSAEVTNLLSPDSWLKKGGKRRDRPPQKGNSLPATTSSGVIVEITAVIFLGFAFEVASWGRVFFFFFFSYIDLLKFVDYDVVNLARIFLWTCS